MSKMQHVMIDLETLATTPEATILSIGAIEFDPDTGRTGRTFYKVLDQTQGRTVCQATLAWWDRQKDEAKQEVFRTNNGTPLRIALKQFREWLPKSVIVWGNGSTFDISIMENAYQYKQPWRYYNVRDVRTIVDLAKRKGMERPKLTKGTAHNALDDAIHQAEYVSEMWQALVGGQEKADYIGSAGAVLEVE